MGYLDLIKDIAKKAYNAELCVITVSNKKPWNPETSGEWKEFQTTRPGLNRVNSWLDRNPRLGLGLICGKVSGNLELADFDEMNSYQEFRSLMTALGHAALLERLEKGYSELTPKPGVHLWYRCPGETIPGNTVLAKRLKTPEELAIKPDEPYQVLIETRGEGGQGVIAPSAGIAHPSGKAYEVMGGSIENIPVITPDERRILHAIAISLNKVEEVEIKSNGRKSDNAGGRPGDDFNRRATWEEVLEPGGWVSVHTSGSKVFWRRPGKSDSWSATTGHNGSDTFANFSTSTPFKDVMSTKTTYNKFYVYAFLNHNGDLSAAARDLAAKGYGEPTHHEPTQADKEKLGELLAGEVGEDVQAYIVEVAQLAKLCGYDDIALDNLIDTLTDKTGAKLATIKRIINRVFRPEKTEPTAQVKEKSQATIITELLAGAEFFHDYAHRGYCSLEINGHFETWPVRSKEFKLIIGHKYNQQMEGIANAQAVEDALKSFEAKALFDGQCLPVFTRIGGEGEKVYLDLCNDNWQVVEVDKSSWKVLDNSPVKFRRSKGMLPLENPIPGQLTDLYKFINLDPGDWILIAAWLVAAARHKGPYPILNLNGEQGSAKSTASKLLRSLIDPHIAAIRTTPRDDKDLVIAATNSWVVCYDNLSGLPNWLSDALCRIATGGGLTTRALYTDEDETVFDVCRPIILNGIEAISTRSDILDRSIVIELPTISEANRKTEAEVLSKFEAGRPAILGGLLTAISTALANFETTKLDTLPRMADFAKWAVAAENSLGVIPPKKDTEPHVTSFIKAYATRRDENSNIALEGSLLGETFLDWFSSYETTGGWEGTANELLTALNKILIVNKGEKADQRLKGWPQDATRLSGAIKRITPNLRAMGVNVFPKRVKGKKIIGIVKNDKKPTAEDIFGEEETF